MAGASCAGHRRRASGGLTMDLPPYCLFLDLETTGTDEGRDPIIEIGCILTRTTPAFPELASCSFVVTNYAPWLRPQMSGEVLVMHASNGLLAELDAGAGVSIHEAERLVLDMVNRHAGDERVILAGSGVGHFDRRFLRAQMPGLDARLVWYVLDIGVVRRLARLAGVRAGWAGDAKPHRALADTRLHLAEARELAALIGGHEALEVATDGRTV
ncbi:MAG: hypothetical protein C0498_01550 [Anaerolinea sp.]|nr:hypothetical protein [Anaerolinea sp.]